MMTANYYHVGLDIGSTTLKIAIVDDSGNICFTAYQRHNADVTTVMQQVFTQAFEKLGDCEISLVVTGSAGMGIAEVYQIPFVQEVVAAAEVVKHRYPEIKTLIDIGGEDAKLILFEPNKAPDIRMNGSCAGGTGAFIDQMATLLNIEVSELGKLAGESKTVYPIASRCGVFSKTDIQNLLSRNVNRADIAASIFHAVALQTVTTLARGCDILPKVLFCGGPFAFIPALRDAFVKQLALQDSDYIIPENATIIPALGCTYAKKDEKTMLKLSDFIRRINEYKVSEGRIQQRLEPLFTDGADYEEWKKERQKHFVERIDLKDLEDNSPCFLGIDSGSTTTKIIVTDDSDRVVYHYYARNNGNPLETAKNGLQLFQQEALTAGVQVNITRSCVTGYGEDLLKAAFGLNDGMVETIAHYLAARKLNPDVSFILDIGGQDMKAIFVENQAINRIEINEACSSGCGSFIEGFANTLGYTAPQFADAACAAQNPCDLGTRCTVFMNSKVKQFLRERASVGDIAAGLSYSVIKNCLYKVLKLKDIKELGEHIVVQGGTFHNHSVVRALEQLTGKEVIFTDIPELMGAYGAALFAHEKAMLESVDSTPLEQLSVLKEYSTRQLNCSGCENKCTVNQFKFFNNNIFYSGNKCEKIFTNKGEGFQRGLNQYNFKYDALFNREEIENKDNISIGIPRILNMYENYPFWYNLLTMCGFNVILSEPSSFRIYEKGASTVMSDNICFPAKLVHGHVLDLVSQKVDRIFMPYVIFEQKEDANTQNSFNCPVVSGYSDVIKSAIDTQEKYGIPLDAPTVVFNDLVLLKKACKIYLKSVSPKLSTRQFETAFESALAAQNIHFKKLADESFRLYKKSQEQERMTILLAGRPYHADPLIQHKISDMITEFGVNVITEDIVRHEPEVSDTRLVMQWAYTNRIVKAAQWVANAGAEVHFVEITSFGCGPDAFIIDEISDILRKKGKNLTLLKVDDVNNIGSLRLRIRSLIESLRFKNLEKQIEEQDDVQLPIFRKEDSKKTILVPFFSEYYSPLVVALFRAAGYNMKNLPPSNQLSADYGLKYANNEICYPATLVVGDIIKALDSGEYSSQDTAVCITQTGGQCRASNYIALIKKALIAAGHGDYSVLSLTMDDALQNLQPGFEIKWTRIIRTALVATLYADSISKMYYATVVREKQKGMSLYLRDLYIQKAEIFVEQRDTKALFVLLREAVLAFNEQAGDEIVPRIGLVGEIYVKYNSFGHKNIVNWLTEQGVEVVIPPLIDFFLQYFVNAPVNSRQYVQKAGMPRVILNTLYALANSYVKKANKIIDEFKHPILFSDIRSEGRNASHIVNLAAQFGEGWLIPAELIAFAHQGIYNAVSIQPFGCIANHVIAKGIERKVRHLYPKMTLLYLDFDNGASEANILNRLYFMIQNAREQCEKERQQPPVLV